MFKLEIENIGTGFQTLGRGTQGNSPQIGMTRKSKLALSGQQFLDYEFDIRYYHTAKCGEVRMQLLVDGEVTLPDDVKTLVLAAEIAEVSATDSESASLTPGPVAEPSEALTAPEESVTTQLEIKFTGERAALTE